MELSRRSFLKIPAILGASVALPAVAKTILRNSLDEDKVVPHGKEVLKKSFCGLCSSRCPVTVRAVDGKAVGISGDRSDPLNRGALCPKGYALLQELYHPDRIQTPLRKTAGGWERISWGQAASEIAGKIGKLSRPDRLAVIAGSLSATERELAWRLTDSLGSRNFYRSESFQSLGPEDAFMLLHGTKDLSYDFANASFIVSFDFDWLQSHSFPAEVQRVFGTLRRGNLEKRARLIQVEPRLSMTGIKSDQWVSIRPGTEGVFALGIAHTLMTGGGISRPGVRGFTDFRKTVLESYTPEICSQICQVSIDQMTRLAGEFASSKNPLAIASSQNSLFNQAAVQSLNILSGSVGTQGGVIRRTSLPFPIKTATNLEDLPESLEKGDTGAVFICRSNPCFTSPEPSRWRKGLEKAALAVSFSSFLDETSEFCHLILPLSTSLESFGETRDFGLGEKTIHGFSSPAIHHLYDTKSFGEAVLFLSRAIGGKSSVSLPWPDEFSALQESFKRQGLECNFGQESDLRESSGKSFPSSIPSKFEPDLFKPDLEPRDFEVKDGEFHFQVYTPLSLSGGEGAHLPYLMSVLGPHIGEQWDSWVEINPQTAKKMGISEGDLIVLQSSIGKIQARARLYPGTRPDTVNMPRGLGHTACGRFAKGIGSNPAEIVAKKTDSQTGKALWQSMKVKISRAGGTV